MGRLGLSRRSVIGLALAALAAVTALPGCANHEAPQETPQEEPQTAGCTADTDCKVGSICEAGRCEVAICTRILAPVCGVDGKTYGNSCEARAAHVEVASEGPCSGICGGILGVPCPEGQTCDLPAGECQTADLQGTCVEQPGGCPRNFDPVCGCDGKTYGNDCERLRAGVQKDYDGECGRRE